MERKKEVFKAYPIMGSTSMMPPMGGVFILILIEQYAKASTKLVRFVVLKYRAVKLKMYEAPDTSENGSITKSIWLLEYDNNRASGLLDIVDKVEKLGEDHETSNELICVSKSATRIILFGALYVD